MSIRIGDIVTVSQGNDYQGPLFMRSLEVLYVPTAPGDSWGFRDHPRKQEIWTTEGVTIYKQDATP